MRRLDDPVASQIALRRRRCADVHRLVGLAHVRSARVGVAVHGDRRDAHLAAGADDAQRDLAAVGDQDLLEHQSGMFPCFFGGFRSRFAAQRLERVDQPRPRVARVDDVVDVAAASGDVRIRELRRVLRHLRVRRAPADRRCR